MLLKYLPQPVFTPETLTGVRAKKKVQPFGHGYGGALYTCHGGYTLAANVEDGDIFELFYTPAGFLCLGGWLAAADIDTGTEALVMDLGWTANGGGAETMVDATDGTVYTNAGENASVNGLIDADAWTGDATANSHGAGNMILVRLPTPKLFTRPTLIQLEAHTAANAGGTGALNVTLLGRIL